MFRPQRCSVFSPRSPLHRRGGVIQPKRFVSSGRELESKEREVSLYIHWPYCKSICPYCDFNRYLQHSGIEEERMERSYKRELEWMVERREREGGGKGRLKSVFFGGGTPSTAPPSLLSSLLSHSFSLLPPLPSLEVTLEANPTSIETAKMEEWRAGGINRLSIGVQSLRPSSLQYLGRNHTAEMAKEAISKASSIFPFVSFDLIYAIKEEQRVEEWEEELREGMEMGTGHMSLYSLIIEPNTPFHQWHRANTGRVTQPNEEKAADMYERTVEVMREGGYEQYEVSNFARSPAHQSKHNLTYWQSGDWIGIGPGAHSRFLSLSPSTPRLSLSQHRTPEKWMNAIEQHGHGVVDLTPLTPSDILTEAMMMGLRTVYGVEEGRLKEYLGEGFEEIFDMKKVRKMEERGLLIVQQGRIAPTPRGMAVLNSLLPSLLSYSSPKYH